MIEAVVAWRRKRSVHSPCDVLPISLFISFSDCSAILMASLNNLTKVDFIQRK